MQLAELYWIVTRQLEIWPIIWWTCCIKISLATTTPLAISYSIETEELGALYLRTKYAERCVGYSSWKLNRPISCPCVVRRLSSDPSQSNKENNRNKVRFFLELQTGAYHVDLWIPYFNGGTTGFLPIAFSQDFPSSAFVATIPHSLEDFLVTQTAADLAASHVEISHWFSRRRKKS